MQVGVGVHARQGALHHLAHAHLVDGAHVKHLQALLVHKALFALVHAADADLADLLGPQCRAPAGHVGQLRQLGRAKAAQAGHGHAVHIAAGRQRAGVEVGMGIEPQHAQLFAAFGAVAGHGADAAQAQAVVATQQDGQVAQLQLGIHSAIHQPVPLHHLGQVAVAIHRGLPGVGRAAQVAPVKHLQAVRFQRRLQARHTQGLGAHGCAACAGANVGGRANQAARREASGQGGGQVVGHVCGVEGDGWVSVAGTPGWRNGVAPASGVPTLAPRVVAWRAHHAFNDKQATASAEAVKSQGF